MPTLTSLTLTATPSPRNVLHLASTMYDSSPLNDYKLQSVDPETVSLPPLDVLAEIVRRVHRESGLYLFGLDSLIENAYCSDQA